MPQTMKRILQLLVVCRFLSVGVCVLTPEVRLTQGSLRGIRSLSGQHHYFGIPYATSSRFQPPGEPPQWEGVFAAVQRAVHCAQAVWLLRLTREDCLQLDVHTPAVSPPSHAPGTRRLPVLLFLHGGGYYYGTKAHYDPDYLVSKNVIVVVINYRLGVFGFLCVNGVANLGLKDQVAALKWIQKNIAAFGGDPDNVTISGQSAGASSAAMHLLSKTSAGLFHKAFLMSGTATTSWAFNVEPSKPTFEDAAKLGHVKTENDVLRILSNSSVPDILTACSDVSTNPRYFKYAPCVDTNTTSPFFHDTPYATMKSGNFNKVPMMLGYTDVEGMLFYGINDDDSFKDLNDNFVDRLPCLFSWQPERVKRKLGEKIRGHYFGKKRIDRSAVKEVVDYYSDWIAYGSMEAFADAMVKYSEAPVYSYVFAYEGGRNFAKSVFGRRVGMAGASHSDDIFYIFKPGGLTLPLSAPDHRFIDTFTQLLANFMTYGDPNAGKSMGVEWPARTSDARLSLRLDAAMRAQPVQKRHEGRYMRRMLCKYGLPGYAVCDY